MSELAENKAQLNMITMALSGDPCNAELIQLKTDLETLIQLTEEAAGGGSKEDAIFVDSDDDDDVQVLQGGSNGSLEDDLSSLEGVKVSAPFSTSYRGKTFHNAVVFTVESSSFQAFEDIIVKVVFSHPTETGMVACQHFLDGRCRRGDDDCKWSHGERVSLEELREWVDPDWTNLGVGSVVLVKQDGGVWGRARVERREEETLVLKLEGSKTDAFTESVENVYPLSSTNEINEDEDDESDGDAGVQHFQLDTTETLEDETFAPVVLDIQGKLGDWENHTRGIGSRLMSVMGWTGGGLGKQGEGRVEPVSARVYPQGKSLDWCMERRELAGEGEDLESVERTLKHQAKIEQRKSMLRAKREKERDNSAKSLFDLINVKLGGKRGNISDVMRNRGSGSSAANKSGEPKKTLKTASNQNLNVENFKIGEKIRNAEKEINRLKESVERHKDKDPKTAEKIKSKIKEKEQEIFRLRNSEKKVAAEQGNRKSSSKLAIF